MPRCDHLTGSESASSSNGTIELQVDHAQSRIPEVMLQAVRNDAVIRSVGLHEPTLEDVFLKFTGKRIRAAEGSANSMIAKMHRRRR